MVLGVEVCEEVMVELVVAEEVGLVVLDNVPVDVIEEDSIGQRI